jgi:hypothetical protein
MRQGGPAAQSLSIQELSEFASGANKSEFLRLPLEERLLDFGEHSSTSAIVMMVLRCARNFCSKEPQDKVFALLGVIKKATRVRKSEDWPIRAGYGKSAGQVYEDVTSFIISGMIIPLPLSMVSDPSEVRTQDLPSWAIDFSVPLQLSLGNIRKDGANHQVSMPPKVQSNVAGLCVYMLIF